MIRAAAGLALATVVVVGCSSGGPDPAPAAPDRPAASAQKGGVAIGITLDRGSTDAAGRVEAIVVVENRSGRTVRWRAGGCDLRGSVTVRPADEPPVAAVPADGGERRVAAFIDALAAAVDRPSDATTLTVGAQDAGRGCQTDHGFADLRNGERLTERADWTATTVAGAPLPPGAYVVHGTFPMLRGDLPLVPAAFQAARDLDPLVSALPIDVGGDQAVTATARDAMEALVAQTIVGDAIRAGQVDAGDASITFEAGTWVVRIALPGGARAIGRVPADGRHEATLEMTR